MMVIWFIGISGAGKTTLGVRLKDYLLGQGVACHVIDGDAVRDFFDRDLGYSIPDRQENIKRIIFSAYSLSLNGIVTIVCNISPFEALRDFCRRKIKNYCEIYLKKSIERSIDVDVKNVYRDNCNKREIVGKDIPFQEPQSSDLVIKVDDESVDDSFGKVIDFLKTSRFKELTLRKEKHF